MEPATFQVEDIPSPLTTAVRARLGQFSTNSCGSLRAWGGQNIENVNELVPE